MSLTAKAIAGLAATLVLVGVAVFATAGTLAYWQAWLFLAAFGVPSIAITLDVAHRDPALLARRLKAGPTAEPTFRQKLVQAFASSAFLAICIVSGLDHRAGWSHIPAALSVAGAALVVIGFAIVAAVFRANTYTAAIVTVERGQRVISTGPYAIVRHPMYAGAFVMLGGIPLALGAWWGFAAVVPLCAVIVWRLLDEERILVAELPGYAAYRTRVRHRLVPFVW